MGGCAANSDQLAAQTRPPTMRISMRVMYERDGPSSILLRCTLLLIGPNAKCENVRYCAALGV
jgi:hypothetical protein